MIKEKLPPEVFKKLVLAHNLLTLGMAITQIAEQLGESNEYAFGNKLLDFSQNELLPFTEKLDKEVKEYIKNAQR